MPYITVPDGTQIHYKDWGSPTGQPVIFSHGWPLNADNFESQMTFLSTHGYRTIAHDRRGHGRSSQPWEGNNMDTYADDLSALLTTLDITHAFLVGHSTGGGEVVRYLARHGSARVDKAVLISSVPPVMVQSASNPAGTPISVFDGFRAAMQTDRHQFFIDVPSGPFFGFNRPGAKISQGLIWSWWQQSALCGFKAAYDCIAAFSETDMTEDMKGIDVPVLLLHGDDDQVVPIQAAAEIGVKLLKRGRLVVYKGGPHALPNVEAERVNGDLLGFFRE